MTLPIAERKPVTMIQLHFYLRYYTHYGEQMLLELYDSIDEKAPPSRIIPMDFISDDFCHAQVDLNERKVHEIHYQYVLRRSDGSLHREWDDQKKVELRGAKAGKWQLVDHWNEPSLLENTFLTAPFRQVFFPNSGETPIPTHAPRSTHAFRVKAVLLPPGQVVCLLGMGKALGDWNVHQPILLQQNGLWWETSLNLAGTVFPLSYKYGIWNTAEQKLVQYESGSNRILYSPDTAVQKTILHDGFARFPIEWRGAGVAIPVFSLRTKAGLGTGEFNDLIPLADWAASVGMRLIQLLPVNDTTATHTWTDSYPYAAISAFALHPLFCHIPEVLRYCQPADGGKKAASLMKKYHSAQKKLSDLPAVDYEGVMHQKWRMLKEIFNTVQTTFESDPAFLDYFENNRHWLVPYAAFCTLRDEYHSSDFHQWPTCSTYDEKTVMAMSAPDSPRKDAILFHYFVQFHLHLQLQAAVQHAHSRGLAIKGDIPIGIYRYSCDAWVAPDLYNMDEQAGAPPDDFAEAGQNWGFPTYNWHRMKQDGFLWWRQRFEQMSHYFDAFRIDHILGFFRIWSIPYAAVEGILGRFVPAIPVTQSEFHHRGIHIDPDRFCKPYITTDILNELFGESALTVSSQFLEKRADGRWMLREAYQTQRQLDNYFQQLPQDTYHQAIKAGLFRLVENVILIEDQQMPGSSFHFRFGMEKTRSFHDLDGHTKDILQSLYVDYFYRRQDDHWQQEALDKLPTLKRSTQMMICGEDLGMVPHCVPDVMKELSILSLEIQRMPKKAGDTFFHPKDAPYLSVVTPSTHDMSTIRGWWEEDRSLTQRFFNEIMGQWGNAPYFCEAWVNRNIVEQHLHSPAMWSIFQLQDLMGIDAGLRRENPHEERINIPSNPRHYWRYRMHISLSELQASESLNRDLTRMLVEAGRTAFSPHALNL